MSPDITFSMGLDVLTAILLIATIGYAVSLNRKLTLLRDTKGEMEAVIARLAEATGQAQAGLEGLRSHAAETGELLQQGLQQSSGRVDELAFLVEKAESLSKRLEASIAAARPGVSRSRASSADAKRREASREPPPGEADLLKSLQGMR